MKKIIFGLLVVMGLSGTLCADAALPLFTKATKVKAVTPFNTDNPAKTFKVEVLEDSVMPDETVLEAGYIVFSDVYDVKNPKRLKQNANFTLKPVYYIDNKGTRHNFEHEVYAKYTTKLDKADMAKSAALTVGNHFVKGLSVGVSAVEGAVKNETGNRLKSAGEAVYEASPLSYIEKGKGIKIKKGDNFLLKFLMPEYEQEQNEPNYEYTLIETPAD